MIEWQMYVKASWALHLFLVGATKTKVGLGIRVGADVIAKIEVFIVIHIKLKIMFTILVL